MSPCRCLILLAAAFVLVGCNAATKTDDGLVPPGAEFRTGLPIEPGYAQRFGYAQRWTRSIEPAKGQSIYSIATLGDLLISVERPTNVVTALRLRDGSLAWKTILGEPLEQCFGAIADDEFVYVNSTRRLFKLQRRNGQLLEVYNLPLPVNMTPLLVDGMAIFGSVNGKVYGFDVADGYRKWTYALKGRVTATPVQDGETVFVTDLTGAYALLEANSGELRWRGSAYGSISDAPVLHRTDLIVASDDQSLYCFAANTGNDRWPAYRSEVPLTQSPTVIDDIIYLVEPGQCLTAIDGNTGKPLWKNRDIVQPIASLKGNLVAHADKTLSKIDPANGNVVQTVPMREMDTILSGPDNSLLLITPAGEVMRIDPMR